jgi:hypothetical protein
LEYERWKVLSNSWKSLRFPRESIEVLTTLLFIILLTNISLHIVLGKKLVITLNSWDNVSINSTIFWRMKNGDVQKKFIWFIRNYALMKETKTSTFWCIRKYISGKGDGPLRVNVFNVVCYFKTIITLKHVLLLV